MPHELFMLRCLELAKLGKGHVAPNPMVGAIIVHDGKIIGEGYHQKYGEAHAEVNAINNVDDQSLLPSSTIYINLEPCAHFGKTPPCADLIVESQIGTVVIGCIDSYAEVAGKGIEKLRAAGINVKVGILEQESLDLNRRFFTFHHDKRPYVILKWAQSADGYMDILRKEGEQGIHWITQPETKRLTHKWRHEEAGIMVGKNTVLIDNPSLTVREFKGTSPTRFVIDPSDSLDISQYAVGNTDAPTHKLKSTEVKDILTELFELNIQSVMVEGGKFTLNKFIDSELWDEARILSSPDSFEEGVLAPKLPNDVDSTFQFGKDFVQIYRND